ncbi:hypothetical protein HanRHA438_Chr17g0839031 [Helianthus annuus]|nr:hypothetical protein HanRHA438_Chr17g0839031 [Helianthus annuus]
MKSSTAAASLLLPHLGFLGIVVGNGFSSSSFELLVVSVELELLEAASGI